MNYSRRILFISNYFSKSTLCYQNPDLLQESIITLVQLCSCTKKYTQICEMHKLLIYGGNIFMGWKITSWNYLVKFYPCSCWTNVSSVVVFMTKEDTLLRCNDKYQHHMYHDVQMYSLYSWITSFIDTKVFFSVPSLLLPVILYHEHLDTCDLALEVLFKVLRVTSLRVRKLLLCNQTRCFEN